jgi:acyl carrier protein
MEMNSEIESQLRDYVARNILFEEGDLALADDASLIAEGVVDSIGVMELAEYVTRQFGFEVPLKDILPANFDSIARLACYVRRRLAEENKSRPQPV